MDDPLALLRQRIDTALTSSLDRMVGGLSREHPELAPLGDAIRGYVDGGKRIRPLLLLLGHRAVGQPDCGEGGIAAADDQVMGPAIALELLHTCALVHDDVIDRAATRRGRPSLHAAFADRHRSNGWSGDADAFGEAVAILVGDLSLVYADDAFFTAEVDPPALLDAFGRFTRLREEVMAGQYLDLYGATSRQSDLAFAESVATLKSGRYSVTRPLQVGAALGGADPDLVDAFMGFGDPLGRAFQVRDDLLGVFGDESDTGKSVVSDLAEGKRTVLIAEAMSRLSAADRTVLEDGLGRADLTTDEAAQLRELVVRSGAREAAEARVEDWTSESLHALEELPIDESARQLLRGLTHRLAFRNH